MRSLFNSSLRLTFLLSLLVLLPGVFTEQSEPLLQFDRRLIAQGEWWRLLSGNLVHYGLYHLLMNLVALALCGYVLLRQLTAGAYITLLLISAIAVGGGLYFFNPEFSHYAGLSGVLHGLIIAGLLLGVGATPIFNSLALLAVIVKLLHEQSAGFDIHHALLPVPVAVDAHFYGAIGGLTATLLIYLYRVICNLLPKKSR